MREFATDRFLEEIGSGASRTSGYPRETFVSDATNRFLEETGWNKQVLEGTVCDQPVFKGDR